MPKTISNLPLGCAALLRSSKKFCSIDGIQSWRRVLFLTTASTRFLLVVLLLLVPVSDAGTTATLSVVIPDSASAPYTTDCEISDHGDTSSTLAGKSAADRAVLMQSPGDGQLCKLPSLLLVADVDSNMTTLSKEVQLNSNSSLAILVSMEGCDVYTKMEIAVQIYESACPSLKFIVFYNNDTDCDDRIASILPPAEDSGIVVPKNITKLTFLSISTRAGVNLLRLLQMYSETTGSSPEFLQEGSIGWELAMVVKRLDSPPPPSGPFETNLTGENLGQIVFWFLIILCVLLIMCGCYREATLWRNGGRGRIHFRRNENGRIIGLQYMVAPAESNLHASNGREQDTTNGRVPISDRLTEEQVLALPEIYFQLHNEEVLVNSKNNDTADDVAQIEDVDFVVCSGSADECSRRQTPEATLNSADAGNESGRSDEEQRQVILEDSLITTTTRCTMCSICIEEFEPGERIRILPQCRHAFHTPCILQWLSERQGCCPLCKKGVIAADN